MRTAPLGVLVVLSGLAAGCASWRAPPAELDLGRAGIVQGSLDPIRVSNGPSGAALGAGRGATVGVGTGTAVGLVGCASAGPFYPLCVAVVIPASTVIGAASGATVGAIRSESADEAALKLDLLKRELATTSYQALLTQHVQRQARQHFSIDLPLLDATGAVVLDGGSVARPGAAREWLIEVVMTDVAIVGNVQNQPYAMSFHARLTLRHVGAPQVVYATSQKVVGEAMTAAQLGRQRSRGCSRQLRAELATTGVQAADRIDATTSRNAS